MPRTIPSIAWSSAASAKTMLAALPPSSSVSRLPVPASARWISLPTSVEPVKAILATPGWLTRWAPVSPAPVTTLTTPGGSPASRTISASLSAVSGVVSAGLSTTVLPQASAGASFQAAISSGKFHGMIWPHTPSGARRRAGEGPGQLVGPARVVEEVRGGERDVDVARLRDRLAAVHRLDHRQLARLLLEQARDAVEVLAALGARQPRPAAKRRARRAHRRVDVGLARLGELGELLLGGGVDRVEPAARLRRR